VNRSGEFTDFTATLWTLSFRFSIKRWRAYEAEKAQCDGDEASRFLAGHLWWRSSFMLANLCRRLDIVGSPWSKGCPVTRKLCCEFTANNFEGVEVLARMACSSVLCLSSLSFSVYEIHITNQGVLIALFADIVYRLQCWALDDYQRWFLAEWNPARRF
jgi:hypothetical protein